MIHNNIIHPLKHPYISPTVEFEEMEGDGMIATSGDANGGNITGGGGNTRPTRPTRAKEADFIFEKDPFEGTTDDSDYQYDL